MKDPVELAVTCDDFLRDNQRLYALKARRRKIALISVEAANTQSEEVRILLADTTLIAGEQSCHVASPSVIIRKLSEFTWDFLLYTLFDFHPVLSAVDIVVFLTGPLYNRRLRKQLRLLSDGEMHLKPGERKKALLGFRGVPQGADRLQLVYCGRDGEKQRLSCPVTGK